MISITPPPFKLTEIQTYSGEALDYSSLVNHQVSFADIAHALENLCRYNGHCLRFYSVAEHSVLVHDLMRIDGHSRRQLLFGLVHDFGEGVLTDLTRPLKMHLRTRTNGLIEEYENLENDFLEQIYDRLGVGLPTPEETKIVKKYDTLALEIEMANIMSVAKKTYNINTSDKVINFHKRVSDNDNTFVDEHMRKYNSAVQNFFEGYDEGRWSNEIVHRIASLI